MKVIIKLKDKPPFSRDGIMRIDDYQGSVVLHGIDGTPKGNWAESEIEYIKAVFSTPQINLDSSQTPIRALSLE